MKHFIKLFILISHICLNQTLDQIKSAKKIAGQMGLTKDDVINKAKASGYSDSEIEKAIEKSETSSKKNKNLDIEVIEQKELLNNDKSNVLVKEETSTKDDYASSNSELEKLEIIDDSEFLHGNIFDTPDKLAYFGYEIFKKDPALFQASSVGVVDPKYLVGPGDEIIIMLWGETQFRQVFRVDREGFIFIPEVGQVFVNGLTLNLLESKLFKVFSQSYESLNPRGRPSTTFLDISLGNLRPLRIQVLGEVEQPGAYTVSPSATLFSALYYFNGPSILGSLRDIQLIRDGEKIASIDFYEYLLTGKKPNDKKLQLDDVIFIPKRLKTVSIIGEVNRSGIYELKPGETIKDLLNISGDLKISSYLERAQIDRIIPFADRKELQMDRMIIDISLKDYLGSEKSFPILDGDKVEIFSIKDNRLNVVNIRGSVIRPGNYDLGDSLKLSELINKADGFTGDTYLERVDIVRTKADLTKKLIKLNLKKAVEGDLEHDIFLRSSDQVRVYSINEMTSQKYVSAIGYIKFPGLYPLHEDMTLYDLIFRSGGFIDKEYTKGAFLDRAELIRTLSQNNKKKIIPFDLRLVLEEKGLADMLLQSNDQLRVYSNEEITGEINFISINGQVKNPGDYELFEDNMYLSDLLFKAGGFKDPEYLQSVFLERADLIRKNEEDNVKELISFNLENVLSNENDEQNYKLMPGDEIMIYSNETFNKNKSVSIDGSVRNPGTYDLRKNMTIKDLLIQSGGVSEDVYKYKIELARIDPLKINEEVFAEIFEMNMLNDYSIIDYKREDNPLDRKEFFLQPYDHVSIRPDPFFKRHRKVFVDGSVYYPGYYTILSSEETIADLIKRSGGLNSNAYPLSSTFTRNNRVVQLDISKILKKPKFGQNITVQDGDVIFIASKPKMISITGEVSAPGFYQYEKRKRIRDVIGTAGGFSQNAEPKDIFITYPNGISKKYNKFFGNWKVLDGSQIVIGSKKEKEPFNPTEFATELTSIIANLAQAIAVFLIAR